MKVLLASRNPDKLREIKEILDLPGLDLVSALDVEGLHDVVEDGSSLEENAAKKARESAQATGLWSLADDTGLEVDALGGAPGVYSSRFAGEQASYVENCRKLLRDMPPEAPRSARFRTVVALSSPSGIVRTVDGLCEGVIIDAPRGDGGFGYDPLFVPEGFSETFAELDPEAKNAVSHRGRAFRKAREAWGGMLAGSPGEWPPG
jgi:XTP/dITP diphosphohydrolase